MRSGATASAAPDALSFPRECRLLDGRAFKRVFDQRRVHGNELFRIHYASAECPRIGLAISKRVDKRAVVRNRIRRQIRESFRLIRPELAAMDFVVLARPAAARADREQLRSALDALWHRFLMDNS